MLYYNRIDISQGTDLAKSNKSKECIICDYCFFNHWYEFQDSVSNGCHDLTMLCLNISGIVITVSQLKMMINVVLFITANLIYIKWLIVWTSISL